MISNGISFCTSSISAIVLRNVLLHSERERAEKQQREDIDAEAEQPDSGERLHEPGGSGIRTDHQEQGHFRVSLQFFVCLEGCTYENCICAIKIKRLLFD